MGLENSGNSNGKFIDSLDINFPEATDALSQADEHIRYIKEAVTKSFPNVTGAVTATHDDLNKVTAISTDGSTPSLATGITSDQVKTLLTIAETAITTSTNGSGVVTASLATGVSAQAIRALIGLSESGLSLLAPYPVGAIYTSVVSTSPDSLFGGTWVSIGQGKVLVGNDDSVLDADAGTPAADPDFVAASADGSVMQMGGSKTYSTNVTVPRDGWGNEQDGSQLAEPTPVGHLITGDGNSDNQNFNNLAIASGDRTFTTATFSSLQPYMVVYMWKRTV